MLLRGAHPFPRASWPHLPGESLPAGWAVITFTHCRRLITESVDETGWSRLLWSDTESMILSKVTVLMVREFTAFSRFECESLAKKNQFLNHLVVTQRVRESIYTHKVRPHLYQLSCNGKTIHSLTEGEGDWSAILSTLIVYLIKWQVSVRLQMLWNDFITFGSHSCCLCTSQAAHFDLWYQEGIFLQTTAADPLDIFSTMINQTVARHARYHSKNPSRAAEVCEILAWHQQPPCSKSPKQSHVLILMLSLNSCKSSSAQLLRLKAPRLCQVIGQIC